MVVLLDSGSGARDSGSGSITGRLVGSGVRWHKPGQDRGRCLLVTHWLEQWAGGRDGKS